MPNVNIVQQIVDRRVCKYMVTFMRKVICGNPARRYEDKEHKLTMSKRVNMLYYEDDYEGQLPRYLVNERCPSTHIMTGFTHTGIALRVNDKANIILPNSFCTITMTGAPLHHFVGVGGTDGEGTSFLSYNEEKYKPFPEHIINDNVTISGFRTW
jgi:hypothetical protein